jgi:hypothetical protein
LATSAHHQHHRKPHRGFPYRRPRSNPFFPLRAQIAIQTGFEILRHIGAYVTTPNLHDLLLNPQDAAATIEKTRQRKAIGALMNCLSPSAMAILGNRRSNLLAYRAPSVSISSIFSAREISEVFSANGPTFSVHQIDDGKIVSVAMPQKFQSERLYINTILTEAIRSSWATRSAMR